MTPPLYEQLAMKSGKLGFHARSLLAEGTLECRFEAAALLHEAARLRAQALAVLPDPSPATKLGSLIEQCGALLMGMDPPAAGRRWGEVLEAAEKVGPAEAAAMLSKLRPALERSFQEFRAAWGGAKLHRWGILPADARRRQQVLRDCEKLCEKFPGVPLFWWIRSYQAEAEGRAAEAWEHIQRARQLEPGDVIYRAVSLPLAVSALPEGEREAVLAEVWAERSFAPAAICLSYALAQLKVSLERREEERLKRALEMVSLGRERQDATERERRFLLAAQLVLEAWLAGREPSLDVLYRAGLAEILLESPRPLGEAARVEVLLLEGARRTPEDPRLAA